MQSQEKSEISRDLIINAAAEEFCACGFQGASVRRICKASGVTNGRLFHHFKDKNEIFLAVAETYFQTLAAYMEQFRPDFSKSLEENSLLLFAHWQNFWRLYPNTDKLFIQIRINPPQGLQRELLSARRRTFVRSLKMVLHGIFAFFYPNDIEQQAFLTGVWLSVLDYTVVGIGLQKIDLYDSMEEWMRSQASLFQKILTAFLYGVDSESFAALRRERHMHLPDMDSDI